MNPTSRNTNHPFFKNDSSLLNVVNSKVVHTNYIRQYESNPAQSRLVTGSETKSTLARVSMDGNFLEKENTDG